MGEHLAGLLDELTKLAEKPVNKPTKKSDSSFSPALRSMGVAAAGGAMGYGIAELMGRKMKFFKEINAPTKEIGQQMLGKRLTAAKILAPILSGTAVALADRYRNKLNQEYSKVKGYKPHGK